MSNILTQLLKPLEAAGYQRQEPALLVDGEVVRHVSGEDINARLFLTVDENGKEWALRHDYTLPLALDFLKSGKKQASLCYLGKVFRQKQSANGEAFQGGLESFGREDKAAADAEIIALTWNGLENIYSPQKKLVMGDMGVFMALIKALNLPPAWQRRMMRDFRRGRGLNEDLSRLKSPTATSYSGVLSALEGADPQAAKALVRDLLSISGIASVGGRSTTDIAERFLEQASVQSAQLSAEKVSFLEKVLALQGDPDGVVAKLRSLTQAMNISITQTLDNLESRNGFLAAQGLDLQAIDFKLSFAREPDYYDSLVFEIIDEKTQTVLAGGGRYDRMNEMLASFINAPRAVPAVGAAFFVSRLMGSAK